jgi:cysteine desulfuration protein SufE
MTALAAKQAELIADFLLIPDVHERLNAIAGQATRIALPAESKVDAHRVKGCVSSVWIVSEHRDGLCHFRCDADSPMVKGLVHLLCELHNGAVPADIVALDLQLWDALNLTKQLTPTRQNGLAAVHAAIMDFAAQSVSG